jgi:hypothetical protein
MIVFDLTFLLLAFAFFILGVFSDRGKIVWFGLAMALFLGLAGSLRAMTITQVVENTIDNTYYTVEVPVKPMSSWSGVCLGMFFLSFLFLVLSVWDLVYKMVRG